MKFHPDVELALLEGIKRRRVVQTQEAARVSIAQGLGYSSELYTLIMLRASVAVALCPKP